MKRPADTFVLSREFGARLRVIRLRAGLTQLELAKAMGRAGKRSGNLVGRIERGGERYPSLGLVADFLRGCRAGFKDILDLLDLYTDLPTTQAQVFGKALAKVAASVPAKWQSQVTEYDLRIDIPKSAAIDPDSGIEPQRPKRASRVRNGLRPASDSVSPVVSSVSSPRVKRKSPPKPDLAKRLEQARKVGGAARRQHLYRWYLKRAVCETGLEPVMTITRPLINYGLAWFRILYETRKAEPGLREKLLAEAETKFQQKSQFPLEALRKLGDGVRQEFDRMEMVGDLDWLPDVSLDEYEKLLLEPGRKPGLWEVAQRKRASRLVAYESARKTAIEQVWREVQSFLDEAGVAKEWRAVYRHLAGTCFTAALNYEPGSVGEKAQLDEYFLEPYWIGRGLDTALGRKLADIMLARFRELAKSLPPNPRPRA